MTFQQYQNLRNYNSVFIIILFAIILTIFNIQELTAFIVNIIKDIPRVAILIFLKVLELLSGYIREAKDRAKDEGEQGGLPNLPEGEEKPYCWFTG